MILSERMEKSRGQKLIIIVIVAAVAVIIALTVLILYFLSESAPAQSAPAAGPTPTVAPVSEQSVPDLEESFDAAKALAETQKSTPRPKEWYGAYESEGPEDRIVDIDHYKGICPDVYAWIEIPGTKIDYPIAYCEDAVDPFWFTHDIHGNASDKGMIITDSLNAKDLSDPMTLIYGNAPDDGTMFSQLSEFRDADFFENNDTINIYMEDAELVYKIYACYVGSSDHIFAGYDFNDPDDFTKFFGSIEGIRDLSMNIRDSVKPKATDHVIGLVTHCGDDSKRLFVHAVLEEVKY